jgi:hypothetical protein
MDSDGIAMHRKKIPTPPTFLQLIASKDAPIARSLKPLFGKMSTPQKPRFVE